MTIAVEIVRQEGTQEQQIMSQGNGITKPLSPPSTIYHRASSTFYEPNPANRGAVFIDNCQCSSHHIIITNCYCYAGINEDKD